MSLSLIPFANDKYWEVTSNTAVNTGLAFKQILRFGKAKWELQCNANLLTANKVLSVDPNMQGNQYESLSDGLKDIQQCLTAHFLKTKNN